MLKATIFARRVPPALTLTLTRSINGSAVLFQQQQNQPYYARSSYRPANAYTPPGATLAAEEAEDFAAEDAAPTPAYRSAYRREAAPPVAAATPTIPNSSASAFGKSSPSMPFPEEARQEYSSPSLYQGAAAEAFSEDIRRMLAEPIPSEDIEIKPDGTVYMPESRYRRILNRAFGAGAWALVPRGPHSLSADVLSREYALFCLGRYVSQVRGHGAVREFANPAMVSESVRSNALTRLCKDLGIANELWDADFCNQWRAINCIRKTENNRIKWEKKALP